MDKEKVLKLAELARLEIDEETIDNVTTRINDVIALVDQLESANTEGVEPMAHPMDAVQRLRADEVKEIDQHQRFQAIAPAVEDDLYLVPKVIDQG